MGQKRSRPFRGESFVGDAAMRRIRLDMPKQRGLSVVFFCNRNSGNLAEIGASICQHHRGGLANLFASRLREAYINVGTARFKGANCRAALDSGTAIYAWPINGADAAAAASLVHVLPLGSAPPLGV